eukprot:3060181-Prymnesium_polylepis.1
MRTASRRASAALTQVTAGNNFSAARRVEVSCGEAVRRHRAADRGEENITPLKRGCWRLHHLSISLCHGTITPDKGYAPDH